MAYQATRGLRNNNPGNIRHSDANNWQGQVGRDDEGFVIFSEARWGIRAMARVLANYQSAGFYSVAQIISRWAPSSENDTASYISSVVRQMDVPGGDYIPVKSEGDYQSLVKAIIKHENGVNPYSDNYISEAIALA